jgi:signal transduction histidine kinase
MNQMLLNVFGNAVEAIAEDPSIERGEIAITTRLTSDGVEMRVEDNGPGIPTEIRDRIFDPFFTTKEVGKGSGQGLTFVYDVIVDKHGGAIQVQSTPETGTTFIIQLPLANSHQGGPEGVEEGKSYANSVS